MSIKQRNGVWYVFISVPGQPRVRRSTGTTDKKAAQEYHDRLKAQLWRVAQLGEVPDYTLDQAVLEMLKLSEGQKDYATKLRHVAYWRQILGGKTPLRSLTTSVIMQALPTHTTHRYKKPAPASAATKNRYLATIRRTLSVAVALEWLDKTPKLPGFKEPKVRVRWESRARIATLITALRLPWMRDVCTVAVATGMREEELLSLLPADVDLSRRQAWIRANNAKSGRARAVPLNDDAMHILSRRIPQAVTWVFERPPQRSATPVKICQTDARDFKRACATIGIADFHFHDLRHTWASWHVQSGTPLLVLKELGGWETLEMVQRYAHLAQSHLAHHAQAVTFLAHDAAVEKA